jgi:hypothetical protein
MGAILLLGTTSSLKLNGHLLRSVINAALGRQQPMWSRLVWLRLDASAYNDERLPRLKDCLRSGMLPRIPHIDGRRTQQAIACAWTSG